MRSKRERKKGKKGKSFHHRKCRSHGGDSGYRNLILVDEHQHRNWHTIFGNKDAYAIAKDLQRTWYAGKGHQFAVKRGNKSKDVPNCKTVGVRARKEKAWKELFGLLELVDVLFEINHVWGDPDYIIYLRII